MAVPNDLDDLLEDYMDAVGVTEEQLPTYPALVAFKVLIEAIKENQDSLDARITALE